MSTQVDPGESVLASGGNTARGPWLWPHAAYETTFRRSSDRANARSGFVRRLRTRRFLQLAWPRRWSYVGAFSMAFGRTSSFSLLNVWILLDRPSAITHGRRQPTRLSLSLKASILVSQSRPFRHRGTRRRTHGPSRLSS